MKKLYGYIMKYEENPHIELCMVEVDIDEHGDYHKEAGRKIKEYGDSKHGEGNYRWGLSDISLLTRL